MRARQRLETLVKNSLRGTPLYGVVKGLYQRTVRAAGLFDVALVDVTNGCNLRCPFCYNDWPAEGAPRAMSVEHFAQVVAAMPLVRDNGVAISCSFEPFLHPDFPGLLRRLPERCRGKGYFSTNLALRLPDAAFATIAAAPLHHLNVSVESFSPATYEACRRGASWPRFRANLERLAGAMRAASSPPALHVITMLSRLNQHEIPALVEACSRQLEVAYHEIRPFTTTPANAAWVAEHRLAEAEWAVVRDAVAATGLPHVNLLPLPSEASAIHYIDLPETRFFRVESDGTVRVGQNHSLTAETTTHLDEVGDLPRFLRGWLRARAAAAVVPERRA